VISPWHVIDRYRYTTLWLIYITYLIFVYRLAWGHW
jgi:hypothetical protein